jgi:8-oxo-dGTP diphosphatase
MAKNPQVILKNRYQVVPRTLILIFDGERVLLQKGSKDKKIYPGLYNGLGGHIEPGEDVLSAARRELKEESGLTASDLHLCGTIMIDVEESTGILVFVMAGSYSNGTLRSSNEGSLHWKRLDEVPRGEIVEDVIELTHRIWSLKRGELFHGHYPYDADGNRITTFN